jgi:putative Ca2+/H+ antiporter (TMEM165/GDT1 family)
MNIKLFLGTFLMIFLAELGDKTQLAVVGRAATPGAKWTVFLAASLALVFSTLLAAEFGGLLTRRVAPRCLKLAAGVLFLVIGGLSVAEGLRLPKDDAGAGAPPAGPAGEEAAADASPARTGSEASQARMPR